MVNFVKKCVDEIYCGNVVELKIVDGIVDVIFVWFINFEVLKVVVVRKMVYLFLRSLKKGGYMVIFGYILVLVFVVDLLMDIGFKIDWCIGGDLKWDGVF